MAVPRLRRRLAGAFAVLLICGCAREDEEQQHQIVELRAAVQAKTEALEKAQAKTSAAPPPAASPTSTAELPKAQARVHELEAEVAKLHADLQHPPPPAAPSMKLDVDVLKDKLEAELTRKAGELRDLVLRQSGVSRIDEISIQRLHLPPEVITPFHSAITFSITDQGKPLRVQFPVTADFGGSWHLPSPDKIQEACQQAREQLASGTALLPAEAPPGSSRVAAPASHTPAMKQVDADTFVMDWGDKTATPSAPATPSATPGPAPRPTPSPPSPNVPAPVMPVQRDIVIKF